VRCVLSRWAGGIISSQGPDTGAEWAAAFYSLIGTAELNGLDPEAYLVELLLSSPNIRSLVPWNITRDVTTRDQLGRIRAQHQSAFTVDYLQPILSVKVRVGVSWGQIIEVPNS